MHTTTSVFRPHGILAVFLIGLLSLSGCGGGGGDESSNDSTTYVAAPSDLIGGVVVMNYGDGRTFTLNFNSTDSNGVQRSDGKTSTAWTVSGLGALTLTVNISYGVVYNDEEQSQNTVYDSYAMAFTTKTSGVFTLREDTTYATEGSTPAINGTFTFSTYPPNG